MSADLHVSHPQGIDPQKVYPFREAASLIPSARPGVSTDPKTLHRWRREGLLECFCRQVKGRRFWFCWGSAILKLLGGGQPPEWHGRTPAQRRRAIEAAEEAMARHGIGPRAQKKPSGRPRAKQGRKAPADEGQEG